MNFPKIIAHHLPKDKLWQKFNVSLKHIYPYYKYIRYTVIIFNCSFYSAEVQFAKNNIFHNFETI